MLHGSLAPPQGWDTNTVRWGENLRKENSKGLRWVENSEDRMPRLEGFEGFILGSKRRWVTPLNFFVLELIYTVTQLWFWTSTALCLCGPSSINTLEILLPYVLHTQDMNQRNPAVSVPLKRLQTVFLYPLARYMDFTKLFSNHIYREIFPWRIKYMSLRHSQGSVPCNSSCYRLVYFWGRIR